MNERHDELASAWLDGELDDEERGTFAADEAAQRASRELARVRQTLAEPVVVPAGLAHEQVSRALAALAGTEDDASGEARVVPMRRRAPGRFRPASRSGRSGRAQQGPWFARVAAVGVLVGGIGVGVAAVLDQDPAVQDGDVALSADSAEPEASGDAAGGAGPEVLTGPVDGDPNAGAGADDGGGDEEAGTAPATGSDPTGDGGAAPTPDREQGRTQDGPDASAAPRLDAAGPDDEPGETATAAAPEGDQSGSTAPADPPDDERSGSAGSAGTTLAEVATAAQLDRSLDPIALRDHLVDHFGPVSEWPADPGAAVQCAALAIGPANGRPQAVIPFERDGAWLELVVPASDAPFFLVPPGCEPAA